MKDGMPAAWPAVSEERRGGPAHLSVRSAARMSGGGRRMPISTFWTGGDHPEHPRQEESIDHDHGRHRREVTARIMPAEAEGSRNDERRQDPGSDECDPGDEERSS
jgi:hypothetical protein